MPPKASKKASKAAKDVMSTWPSRNPYDAANINPEHEINAADHGFSHLGIPHSTGSVLDPLEHPKPPTFTSTVDEHAYANAILQKLAFARQFVEKEAELGPDVNRRMDKDVTAQLLCAPPIVLNLETQEMVRDLVRLREEMTVLARTEPDGGRKMQERAHKFLWAWKELKRVVSWLVPGKTKSVKWGRAGKIMVAALGECLVDIQDDVASMDDEGDGDGEKAFV